MIINHNIAALNTHRQMGSAQSAQMNSMEKLSSGLRINSAKDDAAGLSISEKMRGQIRGLEQAGRNAQDTISLMQTAEGALNETHDILQRMREVAVQSSNDTNTADDRAALQNEVDELAKEITRIANQTEFNGTKLLDGQGAESLKFQIGSNKDQMLDFSIGAMDAATLKVSATTATAEENAAATVAGGDAAVTGGINISASSGVVADGDYKSAAENASAAIETIDAAIKTVSAERSKIGANQNRLDHTINNLGTSAENLTAAESRIRDVDMAKEMMEQTRNSILAQASQAMLAQSNQMPQQVLQLLR